MNKITFSNLDEIKEAAKQFLYQNSGKKHFAFYGEMGAGKTTFIIALCAMLGSTDVVTSPTFSLINEYQTASDDLIFHFDFYRINSLDEVFNIGYEDYFYSNHFCFVEWPEKVEQLLPDTMLKVKITVLENEGREIVF